MARILLIEDHSEFRETIQEMLRLAGHQVSTAMDGREGVSLFSQNPYDIVITDLIMPQQDGISVIVAIRQKSPNVRIIAISGGGTINGVDYIKLTEDLGVDATMEKPFRA
ncbi:MAG: response regulator, partial [Burkholderiaceae bacterium]